MPLSDPVLSRPRLVEPASRPPRLVSAPAVVRLAAAALPIGAGRRRARRFAPGRIADPVRDWAMDPETGVLLGATRPDLFSGEEPKRTISAVGMYFNFDYMPREITENFEVEPKGIVN